MDSNEEAEGIEALGAFFTQFGPLDVYTRVLWEVVLQELSGDDSNESDEFEGEYFDEYN